MNIQNKKGVIDIGTHDALLTCNKILSIQLETISKKLEAKEMVQLLWNGLMYGIRKQACVTNACLPVISGLLEKHVKYMGAHVNQQRNPYQGNQSWHKQLTNPWRSTYETQPTTTKQQKI